MVYDVERHIYSDGVWHCPFSRDWLQRMKRAARACERLTDEQVEAALRNDHPYYKLPPGDFLSEPQDARGLPPSWCSEYEARHEGWPECCVAIYDYGSIPEMVVSNGEDDWPLVLYGKVLTA